MRGVHPVPAGRNNRVRLFASVLLTGSLLGAPALAQSRPTLLDVHVNAAQLANVPGMVSILRNGEIVVQKELILGTGTAHWFNQALPPGTYDVRVEAEGVVTEVKRGVRAIEGQKGNLEFLIKAGQGIHIVEYATGGISREEVAARLGALEAAVARIDATAAKLDTADQARTTGTVKWFGTPCCPITAIDKATGAVTAVEPGSGRSFQFTPPAPMLAKLVVGQKVWADQAAKKVSLDGADPCCPIGIKRP